MKKIYIYLSFVPFFLIVFGFGSYNQHFKLIENPLSSIPNEQWVQESPIQFFIGFFINLFIKNPSISYWSSVVVGFVYLFFAIAKFEKNYLKNTSIAKILFFSPLFLILFYWMGKPDTYTVGSLLLLLAFSSKFLVFLISIFVMVFSHPQIALIYLFLCRYLKLMKFKSKHYLGIFFSYAVYFIYYNNLADFETRYEYITNDLNRLLDTFFTNSLAGVISYFMWLWVPILSSGIIKNKKFLFSTLLILSVSFLTLDNTRIFSVLSVPVIIYTSKNQNFIDSI